MKFKITMTQLVDDDELDYDDQQELGEHGKGGSFVAATLSAANEEAALDTFHASVPIGVLDDYEINIEEDAA